MNAQFYSLPSPSTSAATSTTPLSSTEDLKLITILAVVTAGSGSLLQRASLNRLAASERLVAGADTPTQTHTGKLAACGHLNKIDR